MKNCPKCRINMTFVGGTMYTCPMCGGDLRDGMGGIIACETTETILYRLNPSDDDWPDDLPLDYRMKV